MCKLFPKGNACEWIQGGNGEIWSSWILDASLTKKEEQVGEVSWTSCSLRKLVWHKSQWEWPELCRVLSLPGWTCLCLPHSSHLLAYEVWPWHRCSPELQSTAAGFQSKDEPCCGRSARHRLRAATCRSPLDQVKPKQGRTLQVAYTWVVPWIHMELVPWRKKSQTGKALGHGVTPGGSGVP